MTDAELAKIKASSLKASPAPWRADRGLGCKRIMARKGRDNPQSQWRTEVVSTPGLADEAEDTANAELIALLGTHRDALIAAARERENLTAERDAERRRAAALRETLNTIAQSDWPRERAKPWRPDGVPSKADKCRHNQAMYESCEECAADYARAALAADDRAKGDGE